MHGTPRPGKTAIQSVHAQRALSGHTDWAALDILYRGLIAQVPALSYRLGWIAVLARRAGAQPAFDPLAQLDAEALDGHQPYWALRAHLLQALGRDGEARQACARAIELTDDAAAQHFLRQRADAAPTSAG